MKMISRIGKTLACCLVAMSLLVSGAMAQEAAADLDALNPLMDAVASAAMQASDLPESITEDGVMTNAFVSVLLNVALRNNMLGVSEATLSDPTQQQTFLGNIFASQMPNLSPVTAENRLDGYIGVQPMNLSTLEDGKIQVVGEMYWAPRRLSELSDEERSEIEWLQPSVFVFQSDASALNGLRLLSFSVGTEIDMESTMGEYVSTILVEYEDSRLGFSVQYPAVFSEDELSQDDNSISAELKDGTAGFRCEKQANADKLSLKQYADKLMAENPQAKVQLNEELGYITMTNVQDGSEVFSVVVTTESSVYIAQLHYVLAQKPVYQVYTHYLENSFIVFEVSMG